METVLTTNQGPQDVAGDAESKQVLTSATGSGATGEINEHYLYNVYGLSESDDVNYDGGVLANFGKTVGPWKASSAMDTARTRTHSATTDSFESTATDFDNLTCPGAQAERDENYVRKCGLPLVPEYAGPMMNMPVSSGYVPVSSAPMPQCLAVTPLALGIPVSQAPDVVIQNQKGSALQFNTQVASLDFAQLSEAARQSTTLMVRNIPNDYSRDMLVELFDKTGFKGKYDFIYMPIDFKRWSGLGYAFVNMVTHRDALELMQNFNGFTDWKKQSVKVCDVTWGDKGQGIQAQIERYRNSPVMHPEVPEGVKPLLFVNGVKVSFPPPTKNLRPPRVKS